MVVISSKEEEGKGEMIKKGKVDVV